MEKMSAHKAYRWWASRGWFYDPADDGPEVEVIRQEQVVRFADELGKLGFKDPRSLIRGGYVDI